jgi:hypothetical protein
MANTKPTPILRNYFAKHLPNYGKAADRIDWRKTCKCANHFRPN